AGGGGGGGGGVGRASSPRPSRPASALIARPGLHTAARARPRTSSGTMSGYHTFGRSAQHALVWRAAERALVDDWSQQSRKKAGKAIDEAGPAALAEAVEAVRVAAADHAVGGGVPALSVRCGRRQAGRVGLVGCLPWAAGANAIWWPRSSRRQQTSPSSPAAMRGLWKPPISARAVLRTAMLQPGTCSALSSVSSTWSGPPGATATAR